jgi:4-amino-4-deoxy-L-arabinose transferase-like glycosyltransferase
MVGKLAMKKTLSKKITFTLIAAFFVVGIILRTWNLSGVPISLFGDEIDVGLQAYSILTTGKDYLGNIFPVMFHSFSEYRLPLQLYLAVPFINLFGLNELGVRGAAVVMGFFGLLSFYFLTRELFDKRLAIIATMFMMVSPWHFLYSRQANDAGILLPFIIGGTYFFVKTKYGFRNLVLSVVLFSLGIYAYAISSLFIPLYFLFLLYLYKKDVFLYGVKKLIQAALLGVLFLAPYIKESFIGLTTDRISTISFYDKAEVEREVINDRQWVVGPLGRLFYNKATVVVQNLFESYTQAISPSFLFATGDPNPRQGVEGYGQLYHYDFLLVLIGLATILVNGRYKPKKSIKILTSWLILAPLPSILTEGGATHASRLILLLPPLIIISAVGFNRLLTWLKKPLQKVFFAVFLFLMLLEVSSFFHRYFYVWKYQSWRFWQYGFEQTIGYVDEIDERYDRVLLNNNYEPMLPRFLFWMKYDMNLFHEQFNGDVPKENVFKNFDGFVLGDKYYFGNFPKPIEPLATPDTLIVAAGVKDITNPEIFKKEGLKLFNVVYSPEGQDLFYIFTGTQHGVN